MTIKEPDATKPDATRILSLEKIPMAVTGLLWTAINKRTFIHEIAPQKRSV